MDEVRPPAPCLALAVNPVVEPGRVVQREAFQKHPPIGLRGTPQFRTDRAAWRTDGGHLRESGLYGMEVEPDVGPGPQTQGFTFR